MTKLRRAFRWVSRKVWSVIEVVAGVVCFILILVAVNATLAYIIGLVWYSYCALAGCDCPITIDTSLICLGIAVACFIVVFSSFFIMDALERYMED
jgi:hypothetical protein